MDKNEEKKFAETAKKCGHTYDGGVTEEQIKQWKAKHRKVIRIDVVDGDELHVGYFHRPTLETMAAVQKISADSEMRGAETLFKGCWLGGSEEMGTDTVLFSETCKRLNDALSSCMSSLKNL